MTSTSNWVSEEMSLPVAIRNGVSPEIDTSQLLWSGTLDYPVLVGLFAEYWHDGYGSYYFQWRTASLGSDRNCRFSSTLA